LKSDEIKLLDSVINNPYGKYNGNEAKYVLEALDSENQRNKEIPWTRKLEEAFSKKIGVKYSIAHNSGTSTLHSCLAAVGVGSGDEVIVPAHTVIMCGTAVLFQNAIPVYADSELDTFNISPQDIERKISSKTKAIIVVHMHGLPANMPVIMDIAKKYDVAVIEDCAQCVLGEIDGKLVGTFGDMSSFRLETKKHLSTGEGGIVSTNNEKLATLIRKHAGLGYKTLTAGAGLRTILPRDFQDPDYKRHTIIPTNYLMSFVIWILKISG
jgi:perosamine synthetase